MKIDFCSKGIILRCAVGIRRGNLVPTMTCKQRRQSRLSTSTKRDSVCRNQDAEAPFAILYSADVLQEMLLAQRDSTGHISQPNVVFVTTLFRARKASRLASLYVRLMYRVFVSGVDNRVKKGMSKQMAMAQMHDNNGWFVLNLIYTKSPNDNSSDKQRVKKLLAQLQWNKSLCVQLQMIQERPHFQLAWQVVIDNHEIENSTYLPRPSYTPKHLEMIGALVKMFAAIRICRDNICAREAFNVILQCQGINGVVLFG